MPNKCAIKHCIQIHVPAYYACSYILNYRLKTLYNAPEVPDTIYEIYVIIIYLYIFAIKLRKERIRNEFKKSEY